MTPLGLYLHIPFCSRRCSYCDFNTYTSLDGLRPAYAAALAAEIRQVAGQERRSAETVFFGGGTPSLMSPQQMALVLSTLHDCFAITANAEVTMECNPGSVDLAYLQAMRGLGVNRLSFGAQSAVSAELTLLDRDHTFQTVIDTIANARRAGFDNLSVDLIYGVPGQTLASWQQSVEAVLALDIEHISLYCLTIEPGTPMMRWLKGGQIGAPDPDLAADQYEMACDLMRHAGFEHYEISNWSKPGRACAHNLIYWRNQQYLGLGAGAHGHADGIRYHVVKQPRVYIRRVEAGGGSWPLSSATADQTTLTQRDQIGETMMMGLRLLNEGISLAAFEQRFGQDIHQIYAAEIEKFTQWALLIEKDGALMLTEKGWFLSNSVFSEFI